MATTKQVQRGSTASTKAPEAPAETATEVKGAEELKQALDDLLAEIDEVLETNAEEFVNSYVQAGGQ